MSLKQEHSSEKSGLPIPIGRRVGEIMEEKGGGYTIRTLAARIGMNRESLRQAITGNRPISPAELDQIATGLHVSVDRIRQDDVKKEREELRSLLKSMGNPKRALQLAKYLASVAVGITERSETLNDLGRALFDVHELKQAHEVWFEAYECAKKVEKKYGETERLLHIVRNLMISYTHRREYIRMSELLNEIEPLIHDQPEPLGAMCFAHAKMAEHLGDDEEAKRMAIKALEYYKLTNDRYAIGRASIDVAHYEFKTRNYGKAKAHLETAREFVENDLYIQLIATKEYVKVLLKLSDYQNAVEMIHSALKVLNSQKYHDLEGKFYVLLSIAKEDKQYAEIVLDQGKAGEQVRYLACLFLVDHYKRSGDVESLFRYYKYAEELAGSGSDLLHRGDL